MGSGAERLSEIGEEGFGVAAYPLRGPAESVVELEELVPLVDGDASTLGHSAQEAGRGLELARFALRQGHPHDAELCSELLLRLVGQRPEEAHQPVLSLHSHPLVDKIWDFSQTATSNALFSLGAGRGGSPPAPTQENVPMRRTVIALALIGSLVSQPSLFDTFWSLLST